MSGTSFNLGNLVLTIDEPSTNPGNTLLTLSNPASLSAGINTFSAGNGPRLEPDTTYFPWVAPSHARGGNCKRNRNTDVANKTARKPQIRPEKVDRTGN